MACLLHDIAMAGLITSDHGYWGAQLIEPYVDEEVSWAVRYHQALRYFPDESAGTHIPRRISATSGRIISRQPIFAKPMSRHVGTNGP